MPNCIGWVGFISFGQYRWQGEGEIACITTANRAQNIFPRPAYTCADTHTASTKESSSFSIFWKLTVWSRTIQLYAFFLFVLWEYYDKSSTTLCFISRNGCFEGMFIFRDAQMDSCSCPCFEDRYYVNHNFIGFNESADLLLQLIHWAFPSLPSTINTNPYWKYETLLFLAWPLWLTLKN